MATRIYENVMILSQQPLATEIFKSSFVDNISKRIFVFFLQWSKMANIQSSADHCFDSITMSSPSLLSPSWVTQKKPARKENGRAKPWGRERGLLATAFLFGLFTVTLDWPPAVYKSVYEVLFFGCGMTGAVINAKFGMDVIRIYQVTKKINSLHLQFI